MGYARHVMSTRCALALQQPQDGGLAAAAWADHADALAAKVRAKLDFVSTRAGADDEETEA